jgi:hypothetical protein
LRRFTGPVAAFRAGAGRFGDFFLPACPEDFFGGVFGVLRLRPGAGFALPFRFEPSSAGGAADVFAAGSASFALIVDSTSGPIRWLPSLVEVPMPFPRLDDIEASSTAGG